MGGLLTVLQGLGQAKDNPVSDFANLAMKVKQSRDQSALSEQKRKLNEIKLAQEERDGEWLDVTEVNKKAAEQGHGGAVSLGIKRSMDIGLHKDVPGADGAVRTFMRRRDISSGVSALESDTKAQPAILADRETYLTAQMDALDKKKEDPKFKMQYDELAAERRMVRKKLYGLDETPPVKDKFKPVTTADGIVAFNEGTGEAGAPFGKAPESAAGNSDPSVVKTFEAAHPELVPKRGTEEYGRALEAFIKSGERPYSTFVGLTPDGTKAITFDSRKGTVGLQPLPFEGQIQPKVAPTVPTEQTTAFQQIGTLKEALGQVTDLYDDSFVGPVAGRAGKVQDNWGVMPNAKRAEFRALTANLYNTIIYLRSGKQINEEEAKRLMDELPTMNISPTGFKAKLKKFTWELNSIERGKMKQLKGAGYRNVPEAQGAPPPASSKPRFEIIGVK